MLQPLSHPSNGSYIKKDHAQVPNKTMKIHSNPHYTCGLIRHDLLSLVA